MKKLFIAFAFVALGLAASAQTLNVQSAIRDLQSATRETKSDKIFKYLQRAKEEIDLAIANDATKGDAKTWCYKGLIYSQIGAEMIKPNSKYANAVPDWVEQASAAAMECKRLDTQNEFSANNNTVFGFVGQEFYSRAIKAYNIDKDYAKAMQLCEQSIAMFNESGDKKSTDQVYYLAGLCAKVLHDNDALAKYFKPLVRRKTDKPAVYRALFDMYKAEGQNEEAMKVANNYVKNHPEDYNATLLLAEGYLVNNNIEKANEQINNTLNLTRENPALYAQILGQAAAILELSKDYAGAEARYQESLTMNPNQYEANYGLGTMIFNRAVDMVNSANEIQPEDDPEGERYAMMIEEANGYFRQSTQYFNSAINYIDNLADPDAKAQQIANLHQCLQALKVVYARLEMYDELKPINERLAEIEKTNK